MIEDQIQKLNNKIKELEEKIEFLEKENIETTNSLYEIENSLNSRMDDLWIEFCIKKKES